MKRRNFFRNESGVAAIEFAMIVPLLSIIVMGIVDYGMYINAKMKLQALARTTAQYVVQGGSDDDVMTNIIETSDFYSDSEAQGQDITVTTGQECECSGGSSVDCSGSCAGSGDYVRHFYEVTLQGAYTPILPYPGLSSGVTLQGYARMQYNP